MMASPNSALFAVFVMIVMGTNLWRRRRIRRAVRDLSTPMQRLLGPEPLYSPPPPDQLPEELRRYSALHTRAQWVIWVSWAIALVYAGLILVLVLKDKML